VNPVDCPRDACGDSIGNFNQLRGILWLFKVLVPCVTIAEVIAQLYVSRDAITKPDKLFGNFRFSVCKEAGHYSLQDGKFNRYVPLDSQLVTWYGRCDPINRDSRYFGFLLRSKHATRRTKSEREEVSIEQTR
jgi:hypothetical protein